MLNMNRKKKLSLVLAVVLAAASQYARAVSDGVAPAPTVTPIPASPAPDANGDGTEAVPAPSTLVPNTSRTVQLLLQLQGNVVPNGNDARAADVNSTATQEADRRREREAVFGTRNPLGDGLDAKSGAKPSSNVPPAVSWTSSAEADGDSAGGSGSSFSPSYDAPSGSSGLRSDEAGLGGGDARMALLPLSVIRFVRRNREMVIGAAVLVLVLLGIGAGSATKRS
ncbi:MAG: hypothetical protein KGL43_04320 [Burkholderiales bacterium]|nr:hypothetical protein [Burkholderiales bacterium]